MIEKVNRIAISFFGVPHLLSARAILKKERRCTGKDKVLLGLAARPLHGIRN
jgi:hypothetical protein